MTSANQSLKDNEDIIFKCDKHPAFISEKLLNYYEENELCDTVLIAGSDRVNIQVHRVVMCAFSDYFLQKVRTQSVSNVVEIEEIEASTLKLIVDFMYTGSIALSLEKVEKILRIATVLKIKTLIDGCCNVVEKNINFRNSLKNFRLANELSLPKLKAKAREFIYIHFEELFESKELLTLKENELTDLLFNENRHGDIENYVFLSMAAWINYDKTNREHLGFHLLSMVRFQALTPQFIVENRKSVCKTIESYELICSWIQWHLSPKTRSKDPQESDFETRKIPEQLAVIKLTNGNKINIEAFKSNINIWDTCFEAILPTKTLNCSVIVHDGKLIVDGLEGIHKSSTRTVLYLDLQKLKWTQIPERYKRRNLCQLVGLKGQLCIFGKDMTGTNLLKLYNFSLYQGWTNLHPPEKPSSNSQIAGSNGVLHILDFESGLLQSYDVSSNAWTLIAVGIQFLNKFGFCVVKEFLYVIGGCCREQMLTKVRRFDLLNGCWRDMASLPHARSNIKTTVVKNKIIICDSRNIDEYNLDSDTWNSLNPLAKEEMCEFVNVCNISVPIN